MKFPIFLKDCNLVNPKLDLRFKTDEQNGGEKESYADLMLTAKGNFTLKSLLTGFMAIDIFMVGGFWRRRFFLIVLAFKAKDCQSSELF